MDCAILEHVAVKYGPLSGCTYRPIPRNLENIEDPKDSSVVVAVSAYIATRVLTEECKYIEIDGYDSNTGCWVLSAFKIRKEVPSIVLATMDDEFAKYPELRGCIMKTISLLDQWSTACYNGEKVRGCLKVYICNPKSRAFTPELLSHKPSLSSRVEEHHSISRDERSNQYMRSNRSGIGKEKSRRPTKEDVMIAISKKRGIISRLMEYVAGVSSQDVDDVVDNTFQQNVN